MAFTQWPGLSDPKDINALTAAIEAYVDDATALLNAKLATALGGQKIQKGTFAPTITTSDTDTAVTFPTAFGSAPLVICSVMPLTAAALLTTIQWGSSTGASDGVGTTTGFSFRAKRSSGSGAIRVNWIAIGPA